jgi:DNA-binding HxlR family transcriptional regulator
LDIPKAVLSDRLTGLVDDGILERSPDSDHRGRHLYELTHPDASRGDPVTLVLRDPHRLLEPIETSVSAAERAAAAGAPA